MNIVFTLLFALPIGFFIKQRGLAIVTYLALDAILFSFQSLGVLLGWMANEPPLAFGPAPEGSFPVAYSASELFGYGIVNLIVISVGVGLVVLGTVLAKRRSADRVAVTVA